MKHILKIMGILILVWCWSSCTRDVEEVQGDDDVTTRSAPLGTTDYYWHNGERIGLNRQDDKRYVLFAASETNAVKQAAGANFIAEPQKVEMSSGIEKASSNVTASSVFLHDTELMWVTTTSASSLKNISGVIYDVPFYTSMEGNELSLSHLLYVKLKKEDDISVLLEDAAKYNVSVLGYNEFMPLWYTLGCTNESTGNALQMANLLYESGKYIAAQPNLMVENPLECVNDTDFSKQWGLRNTSYNGIDIKYCQTRTITQGSSSIVIAFVDQGIKKNHEDFGTNISSLSYDADSGTSPSRQYGYHGTFCSGISGAATNNNKGIAGVAPGCKLMDISTSLSGVNLEQIAANGINWAWRNGADVISNSWWCNRSQLVVDAITNALTQGRKGKGTIVLKSAGNQGRSGNESLTFPADAHPDVIAVGAIGSSGSRADFSSYGKALDIVAPGEGVYSLTTTGTGYTSGNGTSFAAPHAAAVVGLILSVNPDLTQREVCDILEKTAKKLSRYSYFNTTGRPNGTWNGETGYGLLDAYAAVLMAQESNYNRDIYLTDRYFSTSQSFSTYRWIYATNVHVQQGGTLVLEAGMGVKINEPFSVHQSATFIMK